MGQKFLQKRKLKRSLPALVKRAREVLEGNWTGQSTMPSPHLYPHQWNWDSAFIAIGYARYNQKRAQQELSTLFHAQWKNGMVPQIVFNPRALGNYFPEPDFWRCETSADFPPGVLTSGITMPPVHAIAALRIYRFAHDREKAVEWLKSMYPKIYAWHEYFYTTRDPMREGLVYVRHPWESGLDNSPTWDAPLQAIQIDPQRIPTYERKDLRQGVPESQRPSDKDYDRYVFLVDLFRRLRYDEEAIFKESPFLIQDPLFNSILSRANEDLMEIGRIIGHDTVRLREWHEQTNRALREKMWHPEHGAFDAYDLRADRLIETITASGFMPLLCGAPSTQEANEIYHYLESNSFCPMHNGHCFSIPNYNMTSESFDSANYWRGPVWMNTNWLLMQGLRRYGFQKKAESVRQDMLELVSRWGFHEYFDPYRGVGYGSDNFSWTAALFIDVAEALLKGE